MAYSARIDELEKKFSENARRYFAPLANEYRKAGDLDRAIEICRAHLPQQPGHMSGHIVYGQALYESRQLDEAKTVFESALALDPENLIALRHLGDIARDSDDLATARTWYLRVLDADPRNDEVAGMLAELDAKAQAAPAADAPADGASGWGEINPERSAGAATESASVAADETSEVEQSEVAAGDAPASGAELSDSEVDVAELGLEPMPSDGAAAEVVPPAKRADSGARRAEPDAVSPRQPPSPSLDSMLNEAFAADADTAEMERPEDATSPAAFAKPEAAEGIVAPRGQETRGASGSRSEPPALDERALAEVDALFDELSPKSGAASGATTGDAMFGDADLGRDSSEAPPAGQTVAGLETREFVPPPRPSAPAKGGRDSGSMAVSGLTSFEQPTQEDSSTRAAFVTETMAELYLQQGFTDEALEIYRQLLAQNPADDNLRDRIDQLERGGGTSLSVAAVSSQVIQAAQLRHAKRPVRTVRSFFGRLAGHHATTVDESDAGDGDQEPADRSPVAPVRGAEAATPAPTAQPRPAEEPPAPRPPRISIISDLFGVSEVSKDDEAAASMLASAFSSSSMGEGKPESSGARTTGGKGSSAGTTPSGGTAGRPAHAAGRELSLDQVFRETEGRTTRKSGAYSFEQFFSDGTQGPGGARAPSSAENDADASEAPEGDLEQFTAWLEGLKRK